jgi:hypothetical protein
MKSNLQGRSDDRKGGFSPPPNTAKQPAGAAVRWWRPRTEIVSGWPLPLFWLVEPLAGVRRQQPDQFVLMVAGYIEAVLAECLQQALFPDLIYLQLERFEPTDRIACARKPHDSGGAWRRIEPIAHQQLVPVFLACKRRPQVKTIGLRGFPQQVRPRSVGVALQLQGRRRLLAQNPANREAKPISE